MKRFTAILLASVCVVALCASFLVGCASSGGQNNTEQQKNRTYMSQVNEIVLETNGSLDAFVDAVASGDIVNIKTTGNTAIKTLSKLSSLEAPDDLKDIQEKYKSGSEKLCDALTQYIDLYSNSTTNAEDQKLPADAVKKIQDLYDEGVADLKAGDEAAAEL